MNRPYRRAMSRSCGAVSCQCCKQDDEMVIVITTSSRHRSHSSRHPSHGHIVTCISITRQAVCQMIDTLIAVVLGASLMTCMEIMMQIRKIQKPVTDPSHTSGK